MKPICRGGFKYHNNTRVKHSKAFKYLTIKIKTYLQYRKIHLKMVKYNYMT